MKQGPSTFVQFFVGPKTGVNRSILSPRLGPHQEDQALQQLQSECLQLEGECRLSAASASATVGVLAEVHGFQRRNPHATNRE